MCTFALHMISYPRLYRKKTVASSGVLENGLGILVGFGVRACRGEIRSVLHVRKLPPNEETALRRSIVVPRGRFELPTKGICVS
jgi:hypothetical protein